MPCPPWTLPRSRHLRRSARARRADSSGACLLPTLSPEMRRVLVVVGLLLFPLLAVVAFALAVYGLDGPPDDAPTNALFRLLGTAYGLYLAGLVVYSLRRTKRGRRPGLALPPHR